MLRVSRKAIICAVSGSEGPVHADASVGSVKRKKGLARINEMPQLGLARPSPGHPGSASQRIQYSILVWRNKHTNVGALGRDGAPLLPLRPRKENRNGSLPRKTQPRYETPNVEH